MHYSLSSKPFNAIACASLSPLDNMALDSYFLRQTQKNIVRCYTWTEPCITFGSQTDQSLLNTKAIPNLKLVQRETGGGALYHGNDISFTFIFTAAQGDPKQNGPKAVFARVNALLIDSLKEVGLPLDPASCGDKGAPFSNICYNRTHQYEISIGGKKLVCLAQKVMKTRYLLQGSISLAPAQTDIQAVFNHALNLDRIAHVCNWIEPGDFIAAFSNQLIQRLDISTIQTPQTILTHPDYQVHRKLYAQSHCPGVEV